MNARKRVSGVTLMELLTVVFVIGILMGLAVPTFQYTLSNAKLNATADRLIASLRLAQSAAVRVGDRAFVCVSTNGSSCTGGSDWSNGWIVMEQDSSGTRLLKVEEATASDVTVSALDFGTPSQITFTALGAVQDGNAPGTFTVCDSRGDNFAKAVIVGSSGLVRMAIDSLGTGKVEDAQGVDISC